LITLTSPDMFAAFSQGGLPAFQRSLAQHYQHGCCAGDGREGHRLLRDLADVWRVLVTTGIRSQAVGGGCFRFEGSVSTAYPNGAKLRGWADSVAASNASSLQP